MFTASLLVVLLNTQAPTQAVMPQTHAAASVFVVPRVLRPVLANEGIGRGLRNMLIGGLVGGVGVAILASAFLLVLGVGVTGAILFVLAPGLVLSTVAMVVSVLTLAVTVLSLVGLAAVLAGGLWFGVNALMVLMRLNPDFKAGPATEYLPD